MSPPLPPWHTAAAGSTDAGADPDSLGAIADDLVRALENLHFGPPVSHVYDPLVYARAPYDRYVERYGAPPKQVVLLGMNPGPWGMTQTGVPFGEIDAVRDWLGIQSDVGRPSKEHPHRPVRGFACRRSEVSGRRLWGWARDRFGTPEGFFARFFVANYCPLLFVEAGGRNHTPDRLPVREREPMLAACDLALLRTVRVLQPRLVVGIGRFAEERARAALRDVDVGVGRIAHPSPANPAANRGWAALVTKELRALGVEV